jgi:NADH:ubiquinone reductase (non-electrogenic)
MFDVSYDTLVVGVGADVQTFGIPGVREHGLFLKEVSDARSIRQRFLTCLDRASQPTVDQDERRHLLQCVIVGGGPTGVELAAELHDFVREDGRKAYPAIWKDVRIVLLEAGRQILSSFDSVLSEYTLRLFRRQNIDVRTESPVTRVEADHAVLKDGSVVPFGLLVWSGGVAPRSFTRGLAFRKDVAGRIVTDAFLRVDGVENVFALGDCAVIEGSPHPMTAQVAQQQGAYLARLLNADLEERAAPFRFTYYGMLAYVGENKALADLTRIKARGFFSFLFWRSAYLTRLVGMRNKLLVIFDWFKTLVFGRDISRFCIWECAPHFSG